MKFLFVHQNMPGQYREMIRWLVAQGDHHIVFLTQRRGMEIKGVTTRHYQPIHKPAKDAFGLSLPWEEASANGFSAAQSIRALDAEGFRPDIVIGHTGWGELTFFKDVWPDVPIIGFFEYFYRTTGGIVGFDPDDPVSDHAPYFARARNVVPYMNIETVDSGQCPTLWQRDRFPDSFHDKLYVCHDGIRTDLLLPDDTASTRLDRLDQPLSRKDEVVTYVARNLEKVRGFHVVMRALPRLQAERPNARIIIVGGNDTSYGRPSEVPGGLRRSLETELGDSVDWSRVHFLGRVPYGDFCRLMQISRCHLYLTMPFVLSWSLLEAMSMGATVIGSDVEPVREVIEHGRNGLLADFFDPEKLADQIIDVLASPSDYADMGATARADVIARYDFNTRCLPEHIRRINALVPSGLALRP